MAERRMVFYVSDGTGITAETIGHSLLTQFNGVEFATRRIAFVDSHERVDQVIAEIKAAGERSGKRPIVINTIVEPVLNARLGESEALMLDVFEPFIQPLEQELGVKRSHRIGHAHGLVDPVAYERRISATNYALSHDDGIALDYREADVILVGVSRSGKTPTCLYLALQFGVKAANYPLTPEDLEHRELPARLRPYRNKLFGLSITPERLRQIRTERRPNSRYADLETCRAELAAAEAILRHEGVPILDTTHASIEEIAGKVLEKLGLERVMF
ncbi:MAG TPA: pyruvate, water dikinase regulatory protein [Pseudomonas sp.]|nr:pyruvate, water dikinase regulatory protein [Pseudomonas sp.]